MDVATLLRPIFSFKKEKLGFPKEKYYLSGSLTLARFGRTTVSQKNNKFLFPLRVFLRKNKVLATHIERSSISSSERKTLKGQMFFIAAIFMIIGIIMLRGVLLLPSISQEKTSQEVSYLDKNNDNIQLEYRTILGIATTMPNASASGALYLYNFSQLVRSGNDARILYVFIVSNGTSQSFFATIGNFMKTNVTGTISFSPGTSAYFSMNDLANSTFMFSGSNASIAVTLNYTANGERTVESFAFTDSTRNYAAGFFDIELRSNGMMVRSKNYYNRSW